MHIHTPVGAQRHVHRWTTGVSSRTTELPGKPDLESSDFSPKALVYFGKILGRNMKQAIGD